MARPYIRKRRYSKKTVKGPLSKAQAKAVARIAKKVDLKENEHKSMFISINGSNMFDSLVYAKALNFAAAQGTGSEQYVGEKIFLKNFHLKGHASFTKAGDPAVIFRCLVIRSTNKILTNSSTAITYSDVFRSGSSNSNFPSCLHVDLHKVDLLYDSGPKVFNRNYSAQVPKYAFDIKIPINATRTWTADNSGYFKGGDYYFIMMTEDSSGDWAGNINYDYTMNFSDA